MKNNKFLIKMITFENDKENMICAFFSKNIAELLKLYSYAQEREIPVDIPDDETINSKWKNKEAYIEDIRILFGSEHMFTALNIYVKVI